MFDTAIIKDKIRILRGKNDNNNVAESGVLVTIDYGTFSTTRHVTGSQEIFYDVPVPNGDNPATYTIYTIDANPDGTPANGEGKFLPTTTTWDIYQDENQTQF